MSNTEKWAKRVSDVAIGVAVLVILVIVAFLWGCTSAPKQDTATPAPSIAETRTGIVDGAKSIINSTEQIDKAAAAVEPVAEAEKIKSESESIRTNAHGIAAAAVTLKDHEAKVGAIVKERDAALARAVKAESESGRMQSRWLAAVALASGLGAAVCVGLWLFGKLPSLLPIVVLVSLWLGTVIFDWVAGYAWWIGGAGALAIGGWLVYQIAVRRKTLAEVVATVDEAKDAGAIVWEKFKPIADRIQDRVSRRVVDVEQLAARARRKLRGDKP